MSEEKNLAITEHLHETFRVNGIRIDIPPLRNQDNSLVCDLDIDRCLETGWAPYYRPGKNIISFNDMMDRFSGTTTWRDFQLKILRDTSWEPAEEGYWFWADISWEPARLLKKTDIQPEKISRFMCLEEYIIVHYCTDLPHPYLTYFPWQEQYSWLRSQIYGELIIARGGTDIREHDGRAAYPRYSYRHPVS